MSDAEKNAPAVTAEATEKETKNVENDGTEGDVQKDNEHQRTINVGNLPKDVTEQQLRDHFAGHEVERVEIYHYLRNTLALLVFKEKTVAQKACDEKDGSMFNGRRLRIHVEYITIRYTKKDVIVVVVDDDMTEEQLFDRVKEHCEVTQVFIFFPLGYVHLGKDVDKAAMLEKLNAAGLKAYDVNGRDQNQHVDLWRAAKLFFRNRNRVQLLNVPQKWVENTDELKKACSEAGTITEAIANHVTKASFNYYARIFFETEEQAAKAAELLNGKVFEGKRIHALHLSSALLPNYKTSVYASPLERTVTEEDVYDHFKQFGEIDFVNRRNCVENAIVCFKTAEAAEKALACTTFPAPTEANKEATKTIVVKRYDGPLVLRAAGVKRKAATQRTTPEGKTNEPRTPGGGADRDKSHKDILQKLQAFYPVYVSNIPFSCPTHVIRDFFSSLGGEVKFIFSPQHYLPYRLSATQPVKTAMVYYTRRNDMLNAIKQLDKKMLSNQHLHVLPGRGDSNFNQQKTVKLSKMNESLSEDAIFRKMRPLGKVVRLTKKSRSLAFVEFADSADVEKILKMKQEELPINCVFTKIVKDVSRRLYNESDPKILGTVVRLLRRNPRMLNKTTGAGPLMSGNNVVGGPGGAFGGGKRPRMNGPPGFGNVPPFNPNNGGNNLNNNQAIQDLLRLAFMSGKNVGESLAAGGGGGGNQGHNRGGGSFNNADPPISNQGGGNNAFGGGGDGGFGAGGGRNNMNNRNQNMNYRGGNRNNQNNNNVGGNRGLGGNSNNNAGNNNNFGNQNLSNNSGGPRGGGGALSGGVGGGNNSNNNNNNSGSSGGMMNNRGNMNNNMNKRGGGGGGGAGGNNLQQQNSSMQLGGVGGSVGGVVGTGGNSVGGGMNNMNKGSGGGMRGGNNQGMGGGMGSGGNNMGMNRSNNNMGGNRNNRNNNSFNDNSSFGGGSVGGGGNNNTFGGVGSNNYSNDNFGGGRNNDSNSYSNDNFGGGRNDSYTNDNNFGGNSGGGGGGRNNFGNRNNDSYGSGNRNDNFGGGNSNFGGNSYNSNNSGSRFNNDNDGPFSGNSGNNTGSGGGGNNSFGLNNNRGNNSSNSRFSSDDNLGGGGGYGGGGNTNNRGGNNFNDNSNNFGGSNRGSNQKPQGLFNLGGSGGGNLGGSGGGNNMSYNNFGGGNSNNSGGNNYRNNDNKGGWNNSNNSGLGGGRSNNNQDSIGRLAGSLFSRRF